MTPQENAGIVALCRYLADKLSVGFLYECHIDIVNNVPVGNLPDGQESLGARIKLKSAWGAYRDVVHTEILRLCRESGLFLAMSIGEFYSTNSTDDVRDPRMLRYDSDYTVEVILHCGNVRLKDIALVAGSRITKMRFV